MGQLTTLTKPVRRVTRRNFMHYERPIVIELRPSGAADMLVMRLKGTRATQYVADVESIYRVLANWHALAEQARRREERRKRKYGG